MALAINTSDIGKNLLLVNTEEDFTDYYLAKLSLVHEEDSKTTGYFSTPAKGNIILEDGDEKWSYSEIV